MLSRGRRVGEVDVTEGALLRAVAGPVRRWSVSGASAGGRAGVMGWLQLVRTEGLLPGGVGKQGGRAQRPPRSAGRVRRRVDSSSPGFCQSADKDRAPIRRPGPIRGGSGPSTAGAVGSPLSPSDHPHSHVCPSLTGRGSYLPVSSPSPRPRPPKGAAEMTGLDTSESEDAGRGADRGDDLPVADVADVAAAADVTDAVAVQETDDEPNGPFKAIPSGPAPPSPAVLHRHQGRGNTGDQDRDPGVRAPDGRHVHAGRTAGCRARPAGVPGADGAAGHRLGAGEGDLPADRAGRGGRGAQSRLVPVRAAGWARG